MVATPKRDSFSTAALSARAMWRLTIPRLFIGMLMLLPLRFQCGIEAREHVPGVALIDLLLVLRAEDGRGLDVTLGVVIGKAGLGIDAAHRADHLAGEQDVLDRDDPRQKVDALLLIDAGVEEDIVQQMILEQRLLQLLRQATKPAPVLGARAAAMRDQ